MVICQRPANGHFGNKPLCAIELKSFNPSKNKIIADLERNLFSLNLKANTGDSILSYTVLAALHWNKRIDIENNEQHKREVKEKYEKILTDFKLENTNISVSKDIFALSKSRGTVDIGSFELKTNTIVESLDTSTQHHFTGSILCFIKQAATN